MLKRTIKSLAGIESPKASVVKDDAIPAEQPILVNRAVICKLDGGLANQMICYKVGRYISLKQRKPLFLDASTYANLDEMSNRNLQLANYDIQYDLMFSSNAIMENIKRFNQVLDLTFAGQGGFRPELTEKVRRSLEQDHDVILCGLWTSLVIREEVDAFARENGVLHDLRLDKNRFFSANDWKIQRRIENSKAPVAIHVRRGDFATVCGNILAKRDFYNESIETILQTLNDPVFFVFSDDIAWCRENLKTSCEIHFVDFNDERHAFKDLALASSCQHFILTHASTFSHQILELSRISPESDRIVLYSKKSDFEQNIG